MADKERYHPSVVADADTDRGADWEPAAAQVTLEEALAHLRADFQRTDVDADGAIDDHERVAAAIEVGRALFQNQDTKCFDCHGPTGLGDGGQVNYDFWNDLKKERTPDEIAQMFQLPIQVLEARNLRLGIYRGGRRPVDLYRRMHVGIKGTPMPAQGPAPGNPGVLNPDQIWAVVEYVRTLPYEERGAPQQRQAGVALEGSY
jgi:mono/diheme cytochrome c family protein